MFDLVLPPPFPSRPPPSPLPASLLQSDDPPNTPTPHLPSLSQNFLEALRDIFRQGTAHLQEAGSTSDPRTGLSLGIPLRQMIQAIKLMRRLCLRHNPALQDFFRVQKLNRLSTNLLLEALMPLQEMILLLKSSFETGQYMLAFAVRESFEMLAEAIENNLHNRAELAASTSPNIFDLCDRTVQKMSIDYLRR